MKADDSILDPGVETLWLKGPRLPPELERQIFEFAALAHRKMIPTFLRVARRIQIWIEPLLYRVLWIDTHRDARATKTEPEAVRAAMESKPAVFFSDSVRHLFLDNTADFSILEAKKLLQLCTNLVSFAVVGKLSQPSLLPILADMRVERLSASLNDLFGSPHAVDLRHPLFLSPTHLDTFANFAGKHLYIQLAALPALTHLCLNERIDWDIIRGILSECASLMFLVNLWPHYLDSRARTFAAETPLKDTRFVVRISTSYWADWKAGAEGHGDYRPKLLLRPAPSIHIIIMFKTLSSSQ
ncbi:hypothetical protein DFH06DRAFT_1465537 [Mycena polygramma]|nr:hypothetical protein DFH06DRAFT_1465537 [Mycena polygramma]